MAVICRITAYEQRGNQSRATGTGAVIILEISRNGGAPQRLVVARTQNISLEMGDRIKCVSGLAIVMINPGTGAGVFILCPQLPPNADWKYRTELEINEETTRVISRGQIKFTNDIGTILRATSAVSR